MEIRDDAVKVAKVSDEAVVGHRPHSVFQSNHRAVILIVGHELFDADGNPHAETERLVRGRIADEVIESMKRDRA